MYLELKAFNFCLYCLVDVELSCTYQNLSFQTIYLQYFVIHFLYRPSNYDFEEAIARNISCNVYIFSHEKPPADFFTTKSNHTHFIRSAIVPNDPADFSRNSYETQTMNNVLDILKHKTVDILKIEHVLDPSRSYDLLYYLMKDGIMKRVNQVYFSVLIGREIFKNDFNAFSVDLRSMKLQNQKLLMLCLFYITIFPRTQIHVFSAKL